MGGNKNAIAKRNFVLYQEQLKDGKQHNGITCFVKELIILAGFINSKQALVDDVLFKTNSIKCDLNDKELFC